MLALCMATLAAMFVANVAMHNASMTTTSMIPEKCVSTSTGPRFAK